MSQSNELPGEKPTEEQWTERTPHVITKPILWIHPDKLDMVKNSPKGRSGEFIIEAHPEISDPNTWYVICRAGKGIIRNKHDKIDFWIGGISQ